MRSMTACIAAPNNAKIFRWMGREVPEGVCASVQSLLPLSIDFTICFHLGDKRNSLSNELNIMFTNIKTSN